MEKVCLRNDSKPAETWLNVWVFRKERWRTAVGWRWDMWGCGFLLFHCSSCWFLFRLHTSFLTVVSRVPTGAVVRGCMREFNFLYLQLISVPFSLSCEVVFLRMIVFIIHRTISFNIKNQCERSCVFLLEPEYPVTLTSSSTAERGLFTNSPGQRQLVLSQLCCHGNQRCRQTDGRRWVWREVELVSPWLAGNTHLNTGSTEQPLGGEACRAGCFLGWTWGEVAL